MSQHLLNITYCHGSENHFLLVDFFTRQNKFKDVDFEQFTIDATTQLPELKIDGVLYLLPSGQADARMRIFNRDGSEAEMCGNGFRCIGKKLHQITGKTSYRIETLSGILEGKKVSEIYPGIDTYSVLFNNVQFSYGDKSFDNQPIPELSSDLKFSTVDVGNPHIIAQNSYLDFEKLIEFGKKVNHNCQLFPQGNNLSFFKLFDENEIFVLTYERGVGLTASCGTAMTATAVLAARQELMELNKPINVYSPGGMVRCMVEKNGNFSVTLSGNATFLSTHQILYDSNNRKIVDFQQVETFENEQKNYSSFKSHITLNLLKHAK